MAIARELSWSLTRSKAMADCPRSAWFAYHARDHRNVAARAYALKDLTTLVMAAGSAVDMIIARTLRAFRDDGEVLTKLPDAGVRWLRKQVENSLAVVPEIRRGGTWDRASHRWMPPLQHHYYGLDLGTEYLMRMEERVAVCLREFERGEAWARIRSVEPEKWHPLGKLDECSVPSFYAPFGLKIWAAVDFAMSENAVIHVIDWKSGNASPKVAEETEIQLAVYAMWACRHYRVHPEQVLVQAIWLQTSSDWHPTIAQDTALRATAKRIKDEAANEERKLTIHRNAHGRPIRIVAPREHFPPRPSSRRCYECRFREICAEGREECDYLPLAVVQPG